MFAKVFRSLFYGSLSGQSDPQHVLVCLLAHADGAELAVVPELGAVEYVMLAHYSGGTGVGGASAHVNRQPGQAPTFSKFQSRETSVGAISGAVKTSTLTNELF